MGNRRTDSLDYFPGWPARGSERNRGKLASPDIADHSGAVD